MSYTTTSPEGATGEPSPDTSKFASLLACLSAPEREQVARLIDSLLDAPAA